MHQMYIYIQNMFLLLNAVFSYPSFYIYGTSGVIVLPNVLPNVFETVDLFYGFNFIGPCLIVDFDVGRVFTYLSLHRIL